MCGPSLLLSAGEATAGVLGPVLGSLVQEGSEHTEVSRAQGHEDAQGLGACELCGEAERACIVQPGEDAQGHLIHVYKYLMSAEVKNMEPDSSQQYLEKGQAARGYCWNRGNSI